MNKKTFNQYIAESNFQELFIREMGWNNPKGQSFFDLTIEDTTYEFRQIADRNGFQVLTCQVKEMPTSSMCKKIDTRLRRTANDYICIYHLPHSEHAGPEPTPPCGDAPLQRGHVPGNVTPKVMPRRLSPQPSPV